MSYGPSQEPPDDDLDPPRHRPPRQPSIHDIPERRHPNIRHEPASWQPSGPLLAFGVLLLVALAVWLLYEIIQTRAG